MANLFLVNVYQINTSVMTRDAPQRIGFPTTGVMIADCSGSPTRSLTSGYNVYGVITVTATGNAYYTAETVAQLATIIG